MKLAIPRATISADDYVLFYCGASVPARAATKWVSRPVRLAEGLILNSFI